MCRGHEEVLLGGMKKYYELFKDNSFITPERALSFDGLSEDIPRVVQQIIDRLWLPLVKAPNDYYPEVVFKLYVSYQSTQDTQGHRGSVDRFPCFLPSIKVHGVELDITPATINSLFRDDPIGTYSVYT